MLELAGALALPAGPLKEADCCRTGVSVVEVSLTSWNAACMFIDCGFTEAGRAALLGMSLSPLLAVILLAAGCEYPGVNGLGEELFRLADIEREFDGNAGSYRVVFGACPVAEWVCLLYVVIRTSTDTI